MARGWGPSTVAKAIFRHGRILARLSLVRNSEEESSISDLPGVESSPDNHQVNGERKRERT